MTRVAINGMGRIGRATFKILMDTPELELVAVNNLNPGDNLAYLINHDSVYGRYGRHVSFGNNMLRVDDKQIHVFQKKDPASLPWRDLNVDIVFECTGVFRDENGMRGHLQAGAAKVILSAPAKGDGVPFVVHGVNGLPVDASLISCASCTTNCIAPVAEIMDRRFGIKKAFMTTVHAYTSSQSIVDNARGKWRRGRAAALNFVPTTTGATKAAINVLPNLEGKFFGAAVRGPVPAGSLADMVFAISQQTTADALNAILRQEAESERYRGVMGVTDEPVVSSDIVGDSHASIVDLSMTQVADGDLVKLMSWYDNEYGFSSQMVRVAVAVAG